MTDNAYNWDDVAALEQLRHGERFPYAARTNSALEYLKLRLAGANRDEAAEQELIRQQEEATHAPDLSRVNHGPDADQPRGHAAGWVRVEEATHAPDLGRVNHGPDADWLRAHDASRDDHSGGYGYP